MILEIEGKEYQVEVETQDSYLTPDLTVAFCSELAADYRPLFFDPRDHGSNPFPPELLAYRLAIDQKSITLKRKTLTPKGLSVTVWRCLPHNIPFSF